MAFLFLVNLETLIFFKKRLNMRKLIMGFVFFGMCFSSFAQQNFIKHKVEPGETVTKIAQKYQITPANIFKLNPDAQNGLKPDTVLLIPKGNGAIIKEVETASTDAKFHVVSAKETIYGLTKLYNVTEEELEKANPGILKNGLQIGEKVIIPTQNTTPVPAKIIAKVIQNPKIHVVESKETKYSISKRYDVSIEELERLNPEIKEGLPVGFELKLPTDRKAKMVPQEFAVQKNNSNSPGKPNMVSYEVQPKETLFSISKKTGHSTEALIAMNPTLKEGLKEGMVLYFPVSSSNNHSISRKYTDLTKTLKTNKQKKLVLLLPFNISKIESDTSSVRTRIRNDKFLNMTLDFYSGALMAIDSAKSLGINVDVRIYDSQETKNSSGVASIFKQSSFEGTDVVIGPFYQTNIESSAQLLLKDSISIISPLSKETAAVFSNVIQTIPSDEYMKNKMFDFMRSDSTNIFGVVDTKKLSTRKYLSENQKEVRLVNFETIETTNNDIKTMLVKGKKNYVILDTENTYRIKMIINTLIALQTQYDIQLVILEGNPKLESDEINMEHLAQLNLMFPSLSKQISGNEKSYFVQKYRQLNAVAPNSYALRGFDITFDTLLRLSQEIEFKETLLTITTEQFENKFAYLKRADKGFRNTGFYILYYDKDLSIKTAN